eukprot:TRINITY_DN20830_c0_g1_i2.p1 TRINITY_DN20830_c0_g1~~TRINITY_DN20830_c0_g1_i2.p1  ORF type:complete len:1205 (-),score=194.59 TRINITY_DN20830_c0_g1_i2:106-3720(-)
MSRRPPESNRNGLPASALPRPSSPPPRSGRSKLRTVEARHGRSEEVQAVNSSKNFFFQDLGPPSSVGYHAAPPAAEGPYVEPVTLGAQFTTREAWSLPSRESAKGGGRSWVSRREWTASACLAQDLRPSTPPRHSARTKLFQRQAPQPTEAPSDALHVETGLATLPAVVMDSAETSRVQPPQAVKEDRRFEVPGGKQVPEAAPAEVHTPNQDVGGTATSTSASDTQVASEQLSGMEAARPRGTVQFESQVSFHSAGGSSPSSKTTRRRSSVSSVSSSQTLGDESSKRKQEEPRSARRGSRFRRSSIVDQRNIFDVDGADDCDQSLRSLRRSSVSSADPLESEQVIAVASRRSSLLSLSGSRRPSTLSVMSSEVEELQSEQHIKQNASSSGSDSELSEEPPSITSCRRKGVLAKAQPSSQLCAWKKPSYPKSSEHLRELTKALKSCPFLQALDDSAIAELVDAMPMEMFSAGDCVFRQGDECDCSYVIIAGSCVVYEEAGPTGGTPSTPNRGLFVREMHTGRLFGESAMLWSAPRSRAVYVSNAGPALLFRLDREAFHNLVVHRAVRERERRETCLRRSSILETLNDEQISLLADAFKKQCYQPGEVIVKQDEPGQELFMVLEGTCVVTVARGTNKANIDIQECNRCHAGDLFGERALLTNTVRTATVTAGTYVEVLCLRRSAFERMLGPLNLLQEAHYRLDPRTCIATFFQPGDNHGPAGYCQSKVSDPEASSEWFAVYRPTSRDAIAKMLSGVAVGKGLNVKGKSAKKNRLSGFVPFLQISMQNHKGEIEPSPWDARGSIFFRSESCRQSALVQLEAFLLLPSLNIKDRRIIPLDSYRDVKGLNVPEAVIREAYIMQPDISPVVGWETGRVSEPAFMDMNLQALRDSSEPNVVLYQFDQDDPMNPRGLLIAYAETSVKPVVSDFDTFTVGSKRMFYDTLPKEQVDLAMWALDETRKIFLKPSKSSWITRWLEVKKKANEEGFHPEIPKYGLGDATSYKLVEAIVGATRESGAIRHGAESFNFGFPQELDDEYLVVWQGFDDLPWAYMDEDDLRDFLSERVEEGFSMPLNPIWVVRDPGWYELFCELLQNPECRPVLDAWYPPGSGLLEKIEALHKEFPDGFVQSSHHRNDDDVHLPARSPSTYVDLDMTDRAALAASMAERSSKRWSAAISKVMAITTLRRFSSSYAANAANLTAETGASPDR